ncbi:InlB B-repeat-containing protein [Pedobacter sp. ASV1-7]|uniref:InlB B-repeat-containing protein n=1 Tax=Pedobacter sp. ASV1-7 TaxID=3145237 RepID=UPI0032E93403
MKRISSLLLLLFFCITAFSQTPIAGWQTAAGMGGAYNATTSDANLESAVLSRGPGISYSNSSTNSYISIFKVEPTKSESVTNGSYYQVVIKAKNGYFASLATINATVRRALPSAVNQYRWTYSLNGATFTDLGPGDVDMSGMVNLNGDKQASIDLSGVEALQYVPSNVSITLRMYAWGATVGDNTSNFGFGKSSAGVNTLAFSGSVVNTLPSFKVMFNSNGGSSIDDLDIVYKSLVTTPTAPTRTGYTFGGWYKEAALTNLWNFETDVITKATTLYAKWTAINYTVTFQSNGGSGVAALQAAYDSHILAPTAPVRPGFFFAGWYKEATLTNLWNFDDDLIKGNLSLYAKWNDPSQSITFDQIANQLYGAPAFVLTAVASSGLPVSYEALTNNISITGNTVTIIGAGLATIKATQPGDNFYVPAQPVEVSFNIEKAAQTITFKQVGPFSRYIGEVELKATSSSGLPIVFTANRPDIATINGNKLQVHSLGNITVTATQEGNENYQAAEPLARVITIHTASSLQVLFNPALSPNGDGINDLFVIDGIKTYPDNQVIIVNKNGAEVFKKKGYDNEQVVFDGRNSNGDKLSAGTYYYSVEVKTGGQWIQKKGYLVIRY